MNRKKLYQCPETHTDTYIVPRREYPSWMKPVPTEEEIFLGCNRCEDFFIVERKNFVIIEGGIT